MSLTDINIYEIFRYDAIIAFFTSILACLLILITKKWHGDISLDTFEGLQKFHTNPTPRIGGIALILGVLAGYAASSHSEASLAKREILGAILLAGIPAFIFGLLEDLTKRISVKIRLIATMASGIIGWGITGISISSIDIYGIDFLLSITLFSIIFTAFAVGGIANSINIIDGFNGLSPGSCIFMLIFFGIIARQSGDIPLAFTCLIIAAATTGFLLVNWPWGKVFMGDGGAYFIGFSIAWIAVLLPERNKDITPWSSALICAYPIVEVLVSCVRKSLRSGYSPGQPDGVHLHMLVNRRIIKHWFPNTSTLTQNSLTSPVLWLITLIPCIFSLLTYNSTKLSILAFFIFIIIYLMIYGRLVFFKWNPIK